MYQWFVILIHSKCISDTNVDIDTAEQMYRDTWYFLYQNAYHDTCITDAPQHCPEGAYTVLPVKQTTKQSIFAKAASKRGGIGMPIWYSVSLVPGNHHLKQDVDPFSRFARFPHVHDGQTNTGSIGSNSPPLVHSMQPDNKKTQTEKPQKNKW